MIKRIALFAIVVATILAGGFFFVERQAEQYVNQPLQLKTSTEIFTLHNGRSFQRVLHDLAQAELINTSKIEKVLRFLHPELTHLKAGTYQLEAGMTLKQAIQLFQEGKEHQFSITFVEGSTFQDWLEVFKNTPYLKHQIEHLNEKQIADKLGLSHDKLEGLFLAETYHYTYGTSDLDILQRASLRLKKMLDRYWTDRQEDLPLESPYDALILASIIEKETAIDSERNRVASVFINRLNKRMRLQTDPTVIYGMGDKYDGNIRKRDLRNPTPYNTYTILGLPPTPIAMIGEASIVAALNPEKSPYLYFVASGKGGHVFSKTLTEHNRAVRAYLKQLRSQ
ncbi:endolytic transglycosylase MltG [Vibrio caribbeanicus]|uniref:endolytic transglycosylase MltG n=1 Tax=Vibrio caribbeanicus TaxID=701175 RepID=UPI0030D8D354